MRIPSYDDLAPSIPDVSTGDVLGSVARVLPSASVPDTPIVHADAPAASSVYACLRSARLPEILTAVAGDFSPRAQRHGAEAIVADVSGLGRLLGPPAIVALELARAAADRAARDPRLLPAPTVGRAAPARAPRYVSRYGLRIEPHPSEHGRVCGAPSHPAGTPIGPGEPVAAIDRDTFDVLARAGTRIAVAPTVTAALLLTLADGDTPAVTDHAAAALAPLPIGTLQRLLAGVHGVAAPRRRPRPITPERSMRAGWPPPDACDRAFDALHRWGIATLGAFAALPTPDLSARLGRAGVTLQQLARGVDQQPFVPDADVPRFVQQMELEWPIDGLEPLSFVVARLLEPLTTALERADRAAAAIRLDLRLVDRTTHARLLQLPVAMRDARVLRTLLLLDLESHPPSAAIDVVTIEADPAPGRVIQYSLLERALPSAETLATLTARLTALVGASRSGTPVVLDTHRPDAFEMRALDGRGLDGQARAPGAAAPPPPGPCLRRFRPPVAVRVRVDRGRPAHVAIDRRGMPGGGVRQAAGPWRASGDWWVLDGRWDRDEWDVELDDGSVCRLFHARPDGGWFLDGVLD